MNFSRRSNNIDRRQRDWFTETLRSRETENKLRRFRIFLAWVHYNATSCFWQIESCYLRQQSQTRWTREGDVVIISLFKTKRIVCKQLMTRRYEASRKARFAKRARAEKCHCTPVYYHRSCVQRFKAHFHQCK